MLSCMSNTLVIDCISQDELCSPLDESKLNTGKQKRRKGQKDNTSGDGELVDTPTRKKKTKLTCILVFLCQDVRKKRGKSDKSLSVHICCTPWLLRLLHGTFLHIS